MRLKRWLLIRAYRRHRATVDARQHIQWSDALVRGKRKNT